MPPQVYGLLHPVGTQVEPDGGTKVLGPSTTRMLSLSVKFPCQAGWGLLLGYSDVQTAVRKNSSQTWRWVFSFPLWNEMAQKGHGESPSKVTAPPNLPIFFSFLFLQKKCEFINTKNRKNKGGGRRDYKNCYSHMCQDRGKHFKICDLFSSHKRSSAFSIMAKVRLRQVSSLK